MKSVVVEIRNGLAAVLSDDGCIVKVKNRNYEIGQVIEMKKMNRKNKLTLLAASMAAVIMLSGAGAWTYFTPYSYVSLDVNPSIEYSLNRFDRVLSVKAINDDGEELLKKIQLENLSNKKIDEAIAQTMDQIIAEGYFDGETEGGIVITTSGKDLKRAEELAQELKQSVEQEPEIDGLIEVETLSVGADRVARAKELGVTPGKLNLVEKLQRSAATPTDFDLEEWLDKPVKDIMKATKDNKKAAKEEEKAAKKADEQEDQVEIEEITTGSTGTDADTKKNTNKPEKASVKVDKADKQTYNAAQKKSAYKNDKEPVKAQKSRGKGNNFAWKSKR